MPANRHWLRNTTIRLLLVALLIAITMPTTSFAQTKAADLLEGGRMRFAIDVDAAERSGLRLSSRLFGPAKVIRDGHVQ